jgi:hypothetical protein
MKPKHRTPIVGSKIFRPLGEWNIRSRKDLAVVEEALGARVTDLGGVLLLDLRGGILDGSKQKGDGGQDERQTPLLRARIPLIVQNGFINNNKNALTFYAKNSGVKKLTWLNVGEDAVATADGAINFLVDGCEFINKGGDKSIQLNEANGARVFRNLIYGGITGVRLGKIAFSKTSDKVECGGNTFIDLDTAWNCAKVSVSVTSQNFYSGVKTTWNIHDGATKKDLFKK